MAERSLSRLVRWAAAFRISMKHPSAKCMAPSCSLSVPGIVNWINPYPSARWLRYQFGSSCTSSLAANPNNVSRVASSKLKASIPLGRYAR